MESLHGFAGGARVVAGLNGLQHYIERVPSQGDAGALGAPRRRPSEMEIFWNPGAVRAQPGMGLRTATGLSGLAGDHEDPGTETPAVGPKSPYCGNSGATVRRRVKRERGRAAEQGRQVRHPIGRWRKLPAGGGNFWIECGGGARGKEWADAGSVVRRSASGRRIIGGAKECAGHQRDTTGVWCCLAVRNWEGGEFHALGLCPRHPRNTQTQPLFFGSFLF